MTHLRGAPNSRPIPSAVDVPPSPLDANGYPRYSMIIEWSLEDRAYIVTIPELKRHHTHGRTITEAVQQGQDLLESLVDWWREDGWPLPEPQHFDYDVHEVAASQGVPR